MRSEGARIDQVVCVIDRESGGPKNLGQEGSTLRALFTMSELKRAAGAAPSLVWGPASDP